jgi:hypothetical protein
MQIKINTIMLPIKMLLIPAFLILFISAKAQYPSVTFFGGLNMANMSVKYGNSNADIKNTYKMKLAFHVGALYDYVYKKDRIKELSIESGLIFDVKGVNQEFSVGENVQNNSWTFYNADVPVYFKYAKKLRSRDKVYAGIGPYVGIGMFGTKDSGSKENIEWGSDEPTVGFKRLDYGLTAKVGFLSYNGLNIFASYDYGLPNVSTSETPERKHRLIRLSLGYTLKFED